TATVESPKPALTLDKIVATGSGGGNNGGGHNGGGNNGGGNNRRNTLVTTLTPGQALTYSFVVTNSGNTDLTGVVVTDTAFSGTGTPPAISCPSTDLPVGASMTCTATYTVTQADVDAGTITNTATATGTPPTGPPVTSPPATATVTTAKPTLTLTKTADPATVTSAGQTITYTLTVTNTGNVPLTAVSVKDTDFTGEGTAPVISCPSTDLPAGASMTCTATYTVLVHDLKLGRIDNTAVATATAPDGTTVTSAPASATVQAKPATQPTGSPSPSPSPSPSHHPTHEPTHTHKPTPSHANVPPPHGTPPVGHPLPDTGTGTLPLLAAIGAATLIAAGTPLLLTTRRTRRRH
ncbi:hypothetical protein ACIGZJ_36910, partial [Kitasatospora sp. NPDC052868]